MIEKNAVTSVSAHGKSPRPTKGVVGISDERSNHHSRPDVIRRPPAAGSDARWLAGTGRGRLAG
jgi:hypothetical protein